jgi:HK97 family phage major capsid protein
MTVEEITGAMNAIVSGAENRSLSDEEVTKYEGLEKELNAAQKTAEIQKRNKAWSAPKNVNVITAAPKGDAVLEFAFKHYLRTGQANADIAGLYVSPDAMKFSTDQNVGSPSAGGYLVPPGFLTRIVEVQKSYGGIAKRAEEISTASGNPLQFPTNDDTANSGEITAEGAATAAGADLVVGTVTLGAYTYKAGGTDNEGIKASLELVQDSAFDVSAFVARKIGIRIGRKQAHDLAVGTGSGQPNGLFNQVLALELANGNPFTYAKLNALVHTLDPAYREMADVCWIMNDATAALIEQVVDSNGRPILKAYMAGIENPVAAQSLLGWPVQIDQASPAVGNSGHATPSNVANKLKGFVAFGSVNSALIVRRVAGVTVLADPYSGMGKGEMRWHAFARMDAAIKDAQAVQLLGGYHA